MDSILLPEIDIKLHLIFIAVRVFFELGSELLFSVEFFQLLDDLLALSFFFVLLFFACFLLFCVNHVFVLFLGQRAYLKFLDIQLPVKLDLADTSVWVTSCQHDELQEVEEGHNHHFEEQGFRPLLDKSAMLDLVIHVSLESTILCNGGGKDHLIGDLDLFDIFAFS